MKVKDIFKKKRIEYFYLAKIQAVKISTDKVQVGEKEAESEIELRVKLVKEISTQLQKLKKEIEFVDILDIPEDLSILLLVGTVNPEVEPFARPLMWEIFAYKTKKTADIFSYPVTTIPFIISGKEIQVLKFEVEC